MIYWLAIDLNIGVGTVFVFSAHCVCLPPLEMRKIITRTWRRSVVKQFVNIVVYFHIKNVCRVPVFEVVCADQVV